MYKILIGFIGFCIFCVFLLLLNIRIGITVGYVPFLSAMAFSSLFLCTILFIFAKRILNSQLTARQILARGGILSSAIILKVNDIPNGKDYRLVNMLLSITTVNNESFTASANGLFSHRENPKVGDIVQVAYNPKKRNQVAIRN